MILKQPIPFKTDKPLRLRPMPFRAICPNYQYRCSKLARNTQSQQTEKVRNCLFPVIAGRFSYFVKVRMITYSQIKQRSFNTTGAVQHRSCQKIYHYLFHSFNDNIPNHSSFCISYFIFISFNLLYRE